MKFLRIILAVISIAVLFSCRTNPEVRINGFLVPNEVQNSVISDPERKQMRVIWYYTRGYEKTIHGKTMSEVVQEKQPLDMNVPKTLPPDTSAVGINVIVYNPNFLRFRIVMLDPLTFQERKVYEGIGDHYELVLNGPVSSDRQFRISGRVDLIGENGSFVVDSALVGDLVYSIEPSQRN